MNEEKLMKVLELYLPKCPAVNILYKAEDLEAYKTMDPNEGINEIDDVNKMEENLHVLLLFNI